MLSCLWTLPSLTHWSRHSIAGILEAIVRGTTFEDEDEQGDLEDEMVAIEMESDVVEPGDLSTTPIVNNSAGDAAMNIVRAVAKDATEVGFPTECLLCVALMPFYTSFCRRKRKHAMQKLRPTSRSTLM